MRPFVAIVCLPLWVALCGSIASAEVEPDARQDRVAVTTHRAMRELGFETVECEGRSKAAKLSQELRSSASANRRTDRHDCWAAPDNLKALELQEILWAIAAELHGLVKRNQRIVRKTASTVYVDPDDPYRGVGVAIHVVKDRSVLTIVGDDYQWKPSE